MAAVEAGLVVEAPAHIGADAELAGLEDDDAHPALLGKLVVEDRVELPLGAVEGEAARRAGFAGGRVLGAYNQRVTGEGRVVVRPDALLAADFGEAVESLGARDLG